MKRNDAIVTPTPGRGSDVANSNDVGQTQKDHQEGMYGEKAGVRVAREGSMGGSHNLEPKAPTNILDQNISIDERPSWDGAAEQRRKNAVLGE